jgi:hypothetical protein
MPDTLWVKRRDDHRLSWHIVGTLGMTRCGHAIMVPSMSADVLPILAKSCETCLRLAKHDQEKAGA